MIRTSKLISNRILILIFVMLLLCIGPIQAFAAQEEEAAVVKGVTVTLDGENVKMDDRVRLQHGRMYVPLASLVKMFDAKTTWDEENGSITIHSAYGDQIVFSDGVPVIYFNKARYLMDAAPFILDNRTYIPLRDAADLLHAAMNWDADKKVVELRTVQPAVVAEGYGLKEIAKKYSLSEAELLKRNGLKNDDSIKIGSKLLVIIPTVLGQEAKPYSEKDFMLLAKLTQVEAGYESYEGQLAVANVILNRVKDSRFPSTMYDVIYSGKQFPVAHNGMLEKSVPNKSVLRAVKDALNGKNNVEAAIYFFNPKVSKGKFWSNLDVIATIGNHSFAK